MNPFTPPDDAARGDAAGHADEADRLGLSALMDGDAGAAEPVCLAWRDDAAPLDPLDQRGSQMIVAGAVLAVIGAGAGVPLLILGMKDRKEGRRAREEAGAIEIRPTLGGLTLRGRF